MTVFGPNSPPTPPNKMISNPQAATAQQVSATQRQPNQASISILESDKRAISRQLSSVFTARQQTPAYFMSQLDELIELDLSETTKKQFLSIKTNFECVGDIFQNSTVIQDEQLKEFIPPLLLGIRDLFGILQQLDNLPENTKNTFDSITHFADLAFTRFNEGPPRQNYMIAHLKSLL